MTYKRRVLSALGKADLLAIGRALELDVAARMSVDELREVIARSKRASIDKIVTASMSRDALKAICKACDLDASGKAKQPLVQRIVAGAGGNRTAPMKLEDQLATLANLGLALEPGVTIDDLLYSFDRRSYEKRPFDLVLFTLGVEVEREPWGRFCRRVWNFDTECITGDGSYVSIAKRLCEVAGRPDAFSNVQDHVDIDVGEAWIAYTVDGEQRRWSIEVNDDWADMMTVVYMMDDLERDGRRFRSHNDGQAMVLYYLDDAIAQKLSELSGEPLTAVTGP